LKRAWESYLGAARDCGLLADAELVANLIGTDDESFRGALAECNAAWFLGQLGLTVTPKPEPKNGKNIDFAVARGEFTFYVEVKAPYVPQLTKHGSGDDSRVLRGRVEAAGEQFKRGRCNVLLLVPVLRTSIHSFREPLVKAVLGEHALRISVSLDPNVKAPPPELVFKQDGKLARLHPQPDGSVKTDLTRISAVVSLEYVLVPQRQGREGGPTTGDRRPQPLRRSSASHRRVRAISATRSRGRRHGMDGQPARTTWCLTKGCLGRSPSGCFEWFFCGSLTAVRVIG
jgi:hypothetical protein